jgi:selenium metabolism protein YedF
MKERRILDCRGLACPKPLINTRQALDSLHEGQKLLVILDNEASYINVQRFAQSQGHDVTVQSKDGLFHVEITKTAGSRPQCEFEAAVESPAQGRWVIYVSSDCMGRGDETLGRRLLVTCIETLAHFTRDISHVIFVNTGVRLVVEGSPVLESLQQMQKTGVRSLACGTCLDHFGLREKVRAAEVSNMYQILEVLSQATTIFSP